ncbi:hypothetical protein [Pseudochelatococcus sp. G4_1912]|uniref:hypothetical protein n=1 Tax=Pseudochelatococcus sp. G4_1912 TaxID=3114288 RepID=UPI0039C688C1
MIYGGQIMSITLQSYSSNTENVTPLPQVSSGFFDNRVVCCLKGAGEAFCNLISSLWDKITSVISYFTGTKTLKDREIGQADKTAVVSQLKEEDSQTLEDREIGQADKTAVVSQLKKEDSQTLEDREIEQADKTAVVSQLKEEASQLKSYDDRADFVKKLTGVKLDSASLKQVMTVVCDDRGSTFMHYAINNTRTVLFLKGALSKDWLIELLKVPNNYGNTPMHAAASSSLSLPFLKNALGGDQFIELLKVRNNYGNTPMHAAASNGVSLLLLNDALDRDQFIELLKVPNNRGKTPMQAAASNDANLAFLNNVLGKTGLSRS